MESLHGNDAGCSTMRPVERLFQTEQKIMYVSVRFQRFLHRTVREWIKLFDNDGDIFRSFLRRCSSRS